MGKRILSAGWAVFSAAVLLLLVLFAGVETRVRNAEAMTDFQQVTIWAGATAYTTTTYSNGYLTSGFDRFVLQVNDDISGTGTITVTPQFSNDGLACSAAGKTWADATLAGLYTSDASAATVTVSTLNTNTLTTTVSTVGSSAVAFGVADVIKTLTGDGDLILDFVSQGPCARVKLETSTTVTPSGYLLMVVD